MTEPKPSRDSGRGRPATEVRLWFAATPELELIETEFSRLEIPPGNALRSIDSIRRIPAATALFARPDHAPPCRVHMHIINIGDHEDDFKPESPWD